MQSSIVVTPVVATESVVAATVESEPALAVAPAQPQVAEQSLPAELADLDLTKLGEEDLAVLAEDFELDLTWLKKQQRLATIKNKSRTTS